MRALQGRDKLWHTPLTLHVNIDQHSVTIPLDKRILTVCKHQVPAGHSAELFNTAKLSVIYTKLATHNHAFVSVRYGNKDLGMLAVQGRAFEENTHLTPNCSVHGLNKLAEAMVSRHTRVPSCSLPFPYDMKLPTYTSLKRCKQILRAMQLHASKPHREYEIKAFQSLLREKLVTQSPAPNHTSQRCFVGLPGAHLLLKFNNNFISRMVSAHAHQNLFEARGTCLNVAAAQGFSLTGTQAFIGSTLESIDIRATAFDSLQQLRISGQPAARVAYIDETDTKHKVPVFSVEPTQQDALRAVGVTTRDKNLPCYVAFTTTHTPILLGDFSIPAQTSDTPVQAAAYLQSGGELLTRRWLAAACNYHPELSASLGILTRAVAPKTGSVYTYHPVPALDMWASQQELNERNGR